MTELLVPVKSQKLPISGKMHETSSSIFLPKSKAAQYLQDVEEVKRNHRDYFPLVTNSGISLTAQGIHGKLIELFDHYSAQSEFVVKEMGENEYDKTLKANKLLANAGFPIEEHVEANKDSNGNFNVVVKKVHPTLFNLYGTKPPIPEKDFEAYLELLSFIHSKGLLHSHFHFSNVFKVQDSGKLGAFDFSEAVEVLPNWKDPISIVNAFHDDYALALNIFVRTAVKRDDWFKLLKARKIRRLISPITARLEIKESLRKRLLTLLENVVYDEIIPVLKHHGYFELNNRTF